MTQSGRDSLLLAGRCFNPPGPLTDVATSLSLSQAVVIPPNSSLVITSGQCGFKDDLSLPEDLDEEIMLAFANAEKTLQAAGVTAGWKSVYQMTTYAPKLDYAWLAAVERAKKAYLGNSRPAWTGITVPTLYGGARLEMTLQAFIDPADNGRGEGKL